VRLWNPATGALQQILKGHSDWVWSVTFSPDGRILASGSDDNTVRLWDPATGVLQHTLKGHLDRVNSVAFSPDGRLLASSSSDETVRLWDPATGALQQMLNFNGHIDYVQFVQDGSYLITNLGAVNVRSGREDHASKLSHRHLEIFIEQRQWIKLKGKNTLWLPPDFRPSCSAICGNSIALGHASGWVSFMAFFV
jgi:WD40 repeat protein